MRSSHAARRHVRTFARVSIVALLAGLLHVVAASPASAVPPTGQVLSISSDAPGYVSISGRAYDPDQPTVNVFVRLTVGGDEFVLLANKWEPIQGNNYGFSATVAVTGSGPLPWSVVAVDSQQVEDGPFGNGTISVANASPAGNIESSSSTVHRTVDLAGWASDPNAPKSSVPIGVYVGGPVGTAGVEGIPLTANIARSDGRQGWSGRIATTKTGVQSIYVYAGNVPGTPGTHALIGVAQVTIYVDQTPPNTTITSAPATATTNDLIHVTFSADEPDATFECRWDLDAWFACEGGTQVKLTPGKHQISVRASDAYGNQDATAAVFLVTVTAASTQPPPGEPAGRAIAARAVKKESRLRIDVGPDSASSNYRVVIQRKAGLRWRKVERVRTRGAKDVVVVNLRGGRYRVVLPRSAAGPALTSNTVRLKR